MLALLRSGAISMKAVDPGLTDPISQLVVEALLARGPQNVTQIATYVRDAKGRSSRTTIRSRVALLQTTGFLRREESSLRWALSEPFVRRIWIFLSKESEAKG